MKIDIRREEGISILALDGKLNIGEGDVELRRAIDDLLEHGAKKILLNLKGVRQMDSSGLGELVRSKSTAARQDATIRLVHVEDRVHKLLEMTRLIGVFDTFNDEIDAVASFRD